MGILNKLSIFGWETKEVAILATLAIRHPILFVGAHGCCKTEGAFRIAQSIIGQSIDMFSGEAKNIQIDELMGYINPKALSDGEVQYISTKVSIWGKNAALFDELLNAPTPMQAKLYELIRKQTLMGMKTQLRYVFSATNPPGPKYDVAYGTLPLIDRFIVVNIPSVRDEALEKVVACHKVKPDFGTLRGALRKIRNSMKSASEETKDKTRAFAKAFNEELNKSDYGIEVSARKTATLAHFMLAVEGIKEANLDVEVSSDTMVEALLGMIPEATGLCRNKPKDADGLRKKIAALFAQYHINGNTLGASLATLIKLKGDDVLAWKDQVLAALSVAFTEKKLRPALREAYLLKKNKPNSPEVQEVYLLVREKFAKSLSSEERFTIAGLYREIRKAEKGK